MDDKRRDKKGRVLKAGEDQLADGRYRFRYTDLNGKRCAIYAWRLDRYDRPVPGKKDTATLREKEKQIEADIFDQVVPEGGSLTVYELADKYVQTTEIRVSREG